jgi:hypothetical protein
LLEQREELRQRHEDAKLEAELKREEEQLAELVNATGLAAKENEWQMRLELEHSHLERSHSDEVSRIKDKVEDFLAKYEEDAAAVERRFERLERADVELE